LLDHREGGGRELRITTDDTHRLVVKATVPLTARVGALVG